MSMFVSLLVLSLATLSMAAPNGCSDTLTNLETALYANGGNLLNMQSAFFPSVEQPSRYLRVVYKFTDGDDEDDEDCIVTFFWSVGSFLFIQPPAIFTYTSLLFNFPSNTVDNVTITLPNECRPLVNNNNNDSDLCTCKIEGITYLDMLTRSLHDYARVNSPGSVTRDDQTTIRIACGEELEQSYYRGSIVYLFFSMILVLPFGLVIMIALFVRQRRERLEQKCTQPSNYANMAGGILTGVFVMIYIISLDIIAVVNIFSDSHEYRGYNVRHSINFYVVVVIAVLDLLAVLYSITVFIFLMSWSCTCPSLCCSQGRPRSYSRIMMKCLLAPYLRLIFGGKVHDILWDEKYGINQTWAILSLMIGPLCGFCSHFCYILVAWLTEPQKTSSIFVFALIYLTFLFVMFRAVYRSEGSKVGKVVLQVVMKDNKPEASTRIRMEKTEEQTKQNKLDDERKLSNSTMNFSKTRLLSTFIIGIIASIPLVLAILGFTFIPIPSLGFANYLRNIIEIALVFFTAFAAHKIFSMKEPDLCLLMKKFKEKYGTESQLSDNLFEACGEIAGEVCHTIKSRKGYPVERNPNVSSIVDETTV